MADWRPAGFFLLRTPLLPMDDLGAWGDASEGFASSRAALNRLLKRADIADALFVGCPAFETIYRHWAEDPASRRGSSAERTLTRYLLRMASRSTPTMLFAGVSLGSAGGAETQIALKERNEYQRSTAISGDLLAALDSAYPAAGDDVQYEPNPTLSPGPNSIHYAVRRHDGGRCDYLQVCVRRTKPLDVLLESCRNGATRTELLKDLARFGNRDEVRRYVDQAIDGQIVVAKDDLLLGTANLSRVVESRLERSAAGRPFARKLRTVRRALARVDKAGVGAPREAYREATEAIGRIGLSETLHRFDAHLRKPCRDARVSDAVLETLARAITLLSEITPHRPIPALVRFREAFSARFGDAEVPLLKAIDDEQGVGFAVDAAPAMRDSSREEALLRLYAASIDRREMAIDLTDVDLQSLRVAQTAQLPASIAVIARLARQREKCDEDSLAIFIDSVLPHAGRLLARHAGNITTERLLLRHLRATDESAEHRIVADLTYVPAGEAIGIVTRPSLGPFEISCFASSSREHGQRIPLRDLSVLINDQRICLRSTTLDAEVVPRITNMHDFFGPRELSVVRFLGALSMQDATPLVAWSWGVLACAPFLPRVTSGQLVLARAQWTIQMSDWPPAGGTTAEAVRRWRAERRLERFAAIVKDESELCIDFENPLSIDVFAELLRRRGGATLVEIFPAPGQSLARSPEGEYQHELIVPFERVTPLPPMRPAVAARPAPRRYPPGSEWLYMKLYAGPIAMDDVLPQMARVLGQRMVRRAIDCWFFVRFGDPDPHLRLRIHGRPADIARFVEPRVERAAARLLADGVIARVQMDTYDVEVSRYGGLVGLQLAERIFHADSIAVVALLDANTYDDEALLLRRAVAVESVDALLGDFEIDAGERTSLIAGARRHLIGNADGEAKRRLSQEARVLRPYLAAAGAGTPAAKRLRAVLRRRSSMIRVLAGELRNRSAAGGLTAGFDSIVVSCIHMHLNRLLRPSVADEELLVYDSLLRKWRETGGRRCVER